MRPSLASLFPRKTIMFHISFFDTCVCLLLGSISFQNANSQSYSIANFAPASSYSFGPQYNNRFLPSGNVFAALTSSGTMFCNYYNGATTVCVNSNVICNSGELILTRDSRLYFYGTVFIFGTNTHTSQMVLFSIQVTSSSVTPTLLSTTNFEENLGCLDVDYSHRWLIVSGATKYFLFDIQDPASPRLSDTFYSSLQSLAIHPRGVSIRRNLICNAAGLCVRISNGKFMGIAGQLVSGRSLKIYDDYIIHWGSPLTIYSLNFQSLGTYAGTWFLDGLRSGNLFLLGDASKVYVLNISDPSSIKTLYTGTHCTVSLTNDKYAIYSANWGSGVRLQTITLSGFGDYQAFYEKSEWRNYGIFVNSLTYKNSSSRFVFNYGASYTQSLGHLVEDTYAAINLTITYNLTSLPIDYGIEQLIDNSWRLLTANAIFTQAHIAAGNVRIRYLNLDFPMSKNLNQTVSLIANNNRGSTLPVNVSLAFFYGPGNCPANASCTPTSFRCNSGYTIDTSGTACIACPSGSFKQESGNGPCSVCPPNSGCTDSANTFFPCLSGFTLNATSCIPCKQGYYKSKTGNEVCTVCPENAQCPSQGLTSFTCNAGYAPSADLLNCQQCSVGTFKPQQGNQPCANCPNDASCIDRVSFVCNAGFTISTSQASCIPCPVDTFKSQSGNDACTSCPANADCSTGTLFFCKKNYYWNITLLGCYPTAPESVPVSPTTDSNFLTIILNSPLYLGLSISGIVTLFIACLIVSVLYYRKRNSGRWKDASSFTASSSTTGMTSVLTNSTSGSQYPVTSVSRRSSLQTSGYTARNTGNTLRGLPIVIGTQRRRQH